MLSNTRLLASLIAASAALLASAACGPTARNDEGSDVDTADEADDTCVPIADFETCGGGVDDDCDGATDCDDPDCAEADLCQGGGGGGCEFETPTASLEMPDGEGCTSGAEQLGSNASTGCETYDSPLEFQGFPAGATLENASDLISVCMIAEHSWIPDLQIELHCPDGTMVELIEFLGRENFAELGVPNESDDPNLAGTGWQYCFVPGAANPPILNYVAANDPGTVPAGDYQPAGDFASFVGCPLNGEWMLQAQDRWGADNGFVFSWQINFSESLADDCQID